jgi:uncharacterized repeat protein (TIGR03803 family)
MKSCDYARSALSSCVAAAMLAACGVLQQPIGTLGAMQQDVTAQSREHRAGSSYYEVLTNFNGVNGKNPYGGLVALHGKLYGTTSGGYDASQALGNVFSITTAGTERVLYSFQRDPDGNDPEASLTVVNGKLFGTTAHGGKYGLGTIFSVTRTGKEDVVYSFGNGPSDGEAPLAALINVNGILYGTTYEGTGSSGSGTVFSVTLQGAETVLHRFTNYPNDGAWPQAALVHVNGLLYGTTTAGGSAQFGHNGAGTVFSITPSGAEKVVYNFNPSERKGHLHNQHGDGFDPWASLTDINGTLYGTTAYRGNRGAVGCGTAFTISASGAEKILHAFHQIGGGCTPRAALLKVRNTLYGTTYVGGAYDEGTLFSMSTSGKETLLHSFGAGADGSYPMSGLIQLHGTLYGTTTFGGTYGDGTVFALTP